MKAEVTSEDSDSLTTSFTPHLQNFYTTFDALQEFLDTVAPQIHQIDQQRQSSILDQADEVLSQIPKAELEQVAADLEKIGKTIEAAAAKAKNSSSQPSSPLGSGPVSIGEDATRLALTFVTGVLAKPKLPILLRSLVPMAVGTFEALVGQLIAAFYYVRPGLLPKEEKEFSLADLEQFSTIKEASIDAIQRRVDNILAGGLDDWVKWFGRKGIEIDLKQLFLDWPETVELFQRRHIIIHNAGRVSKRYITKVSDFERNPPSIGTELPPDAEYVQGALDNLNVAGFLLTAFVHRNLTGRPSESPILGQIWLRAGYLIRLER